MALIDGLMRQARYGAELAGVAWPQFVRPLVLELVSHRAIREVLPGVYHWTAFHPRIRMPVDSYYIEFARVVVDPLVPREGLEWFEGRCPRARLCSPTAIISVIVSALRRRSGCPIRCCYAGLHEFAGGPVVEGFAFGEELVPGITAHQLGAICPDDTALHIWTAGGGALGFADGLTRPRGGGLSFVPGLLMGDDPSAVRAELRESLGRLLDLDFDNVLFARRAADLRRQSRARRDAPDARGRPLRVLGELLARAHHRRAGGRAAEELVFADFTTGAEADLDMVTAIARQMVGRWGMSPVIGPISMLPPTGRSSSCSTGRARHAPTRAIMDAEVRRIVDECYADAVETLRAHRESLDRLAGRLLEAETLDEGDAYDAASLPRPSHDDPASLRSSANEASR